MKVTKTPDMVRSALGSGNAGSIAGVTIGPPSPPSGPGQGIVSSTSNTASWQPIVSTITADGTVLLGPNVAIASGSNISLSMASNTVTIHGTLTASYGSNSNDVASAGAPGASTLISRADHVHRGVTAIAHSSNTLYGTVTLTTPGNTVAIGTRLPERSRCPPPTSPSRSRITPAPAPNSSGTATTS
jgi:hypothetical protein